MHFRFIAPHLRSIDASSGEVLACCVFEDERPMRGVAALVDWRMTSRISRHIQQGHIRARLGETTLIPARPRIPFEKLLLFGLGPMCRFDENVFDITIRKMLDTLTKMRVRMAVVERPARHTFIIDLPDAIDRILQACRQYPDQDIWTLVEESAEHKRAAAHLAELRRQKTSQSG